MELWVVGQYLSGQGADIAWAFQGVFDSREKAVKACRTEKYCIWPARLNESLPHESFEAPGCEYPLYV